MCGSPRRSAPSAGRGWRGACCRSRRRRASASAWASESPHGRRLRLSGSAALTTEQGRIRAGGLTGRRRGMPLCHGTLLATAWVSSCGWEEERGAIGSRSSRLAAI
jgi:hypothetical protein